MKNWPKLAFLILVFLLVLNLTGCGGGKQNTEGEKKDPSNTNRIVSASGPIGSGWYPMSVLIGDIWMDSIEGLNVSVIEGGGIGNIKMINEGIDAQVGLTFASDFADAINNRGPFKEGKYDSIMILGALYPTFWNIGVLDKSPIQKVEDILGRTLLPGNPGDTGETTFQRILEVHGLTYDDIKKSGGQISFGSYADGANMLKDGIVDMVFFGGSPNVTSLTEVDATNPVRVIPLSEEALKKLGEMGFGYTVDMKIPAGTYKNLKKDVPCLVTMGIMVVNKNMDEETVYKLTKSLWENVDRIKKEQPVRGKWFSAENGYKKVFDPKYIHPGALRYYKEVGVTG
ncbi:TAXI family TRAP transporter solute-binding subunit [Desulfallas sp. Bu1-1]|uniref:TAXI family TRAP transporter solute-binding subunit n=1 Tax=Desulfallas sp. Bu1-1 TaxID=2787620 RepID=UPI00189F1FBB|nr:TAXI family TRAP transporter solute-binding subunit [Desulfallas sp. Bu1-1]MBF7083663.1 TAXI family TRAP transporter solute-binding subunit [Desulfallas sp. Bu1-1]